MANLCKIGAGQNRRAGSLCRKTGQTWPVSWSRNTVPCFPKGHFVRQSECSWKVKQIIHLCLAFVSSPSLSEDVIMSEGTLESRSASIIPKGSSWATWCPRIYRRIKPRSGAGMQQRPTRGGKEERTWIGKKEGKAEEMGERHNTNTTDVFRCTQRTDFTREEDRTGQARWRDRSGERNERQRWGTEKRREREGNINTRQAH